MATDVGQAYYGWSHEEFPDRNDSEDVSIARMLDHGSISFGRYAVESLSWEKRSVFTYNKCQEELEKCKAPGLVAQKKAFFEEHYRKLRAQKALQENQQTELTLDYSGDGSVSSQTGEEYEPALQLESLGDGEANVTNNLSEDKNVTIEQEMNCSEALEIRSFDSKLLNLDSLRSSMENVDQEKKSNNACELHHSDPGFMEQRSSVRSIEGVEQNDLRNVENKNMSKTEESAASNIGSEAADQGCATESKTARMGDSKLRPANNIVQDKTKQIAKKSREARMSVPQTKEAIVSVRNDLKLDTRTRLDLVKSSNGRKALQKSSGKAESCVTSNKPTSNRVTSSKMSAVSASNRALTENKPTSNRVTSNKTSASIASDRPLTAVRPNVTIPRPFSFATERRAAAPAGIRETAQRMKSKASSRLEQSLILAKSGLHVQVNLKKTATTSSANGRGRENRSLDLPPRSKSNPNAGIEKRLASNIKGDKGKEGIGVGTLRESQGVRTMITTISTITTTSTDRNLQMGNKKTIVPQSEDPLFGGRRPRTADFPLDGRKPRREMPRWR